jgi:hypothetical protein
MVTRGPRSYGSGVEKALYRLARGTCYFPDCPHPIFELVDNEPIVAVEIAHIYGALRGSARFVETMTDDERRAFENLILLCTVHHKVVDGPRRDSYPPELLQQWKRHNEPAEGIEALESAGLTDEILEKLLEQVVAKVGPTRKIEVNLVPGLMTTAMGAAVTDDLETLHRILDINEHLKAHQQVAVADIRNTGTLAVSIAAVDLWVVLGDPEQPAHFTLMGRNDFPLQNPGLSHRLEDGDAASWLTKMETIIDMVAGAKAADLDVVGIRARVRLATGEEAESQLMTWVEPS